MSMTTKEQLTARMRTLGVLYAECRTEAGETGLSIRSEKLPVLQIKDFLDWEDVQDKTVSMAEHAGRQGNRALDLLEWLKVTTGMRRTLPGRTPKPTRKRRTLPARTAKPTGKTLNVRVLRQTASQPGPERLEHGGRDTFPVPVHEAEDPDRPDCSKTVRDVLEGFLLYPGDTVRVERADARATTRPVAENGD